MGVTAAAASPRITGGRKRVYPRRPSPRFALRSASTGREGGRRSLPQCPPAPLEPKTFWERVQDDGDLIRFKIVLLTALALLTAALEWVA